MEFHWKDYFKLFGSSSLDSGYETLNTNIEELYQAFKARMHAELIEDPKPKPLTGPPQVDGKESYIMSVKEYQDLHKQEKNKCP